MFLMVHTVYFVFIWLYGILSFSPFFFFFLGLQTSSLAIILWVKNTKPEMVFCFCQCLSLSLSPSLLITPVLFCPSFQHSAIKPSSSSNRPGTVNSDQPPPPHDPSYVHVRRSGLSCPAKTCALCLKRETHPPPNLCSPSKHRGRLEGWGGEGRGSAVHGGGHHIMGREGHWGLGKSTSQWPPASSAAKHQFTKSKHSERAW